MSEVTTTPDGESVPTAIETQVANTLAEVATTDAGVDSDDDDVEDDEGDATASEDDGIRLSDDEEDLDVGTHKRAGVEIDVIAGKGPTQKWMTDPAFVKYRQIPLTNWIVKFNNVEASSGAKEKYQKKREKVYAFFGEFLRVKDAAQYATLVWVTIPDIILKVKIVLYNVHLTYCMFRFVICTPSKLSSWST